MGYLCVPVNTHGQANNGENNTPPKPQKERKAHSNVVGGKYVANLINKLGNSL